MLLLQPVLHEHIHALLEFEVQVALIVQGHLWLVILEGLLRPDALLLFIERHELVAHDLAKF